MKNYFSIMELHYANWILESDAELLHGPVFVQWAKNVRIWFSNLYATIRKVRTKMRVSYISAIQRVWKSLRSTTIEKVVSYLDAPVNYVGYFFNTSNDNRIYAQ